MTDPDLEQRLQAAEWERMLKLGHITLADALMLYLRASAPANAYLADRVELALLDYQSGKYTDLAEPFGVAMGKRERNAMERETLRSHIRFHVDHFHSFGHNKGNPSDSEGSAFAAAASLLKMEPATVYSLYYGR